MGNVKFTGILKLSLDERAIGAVRTLWTRLPAEARPLSIDNLHVTLVHQSHLKAFKSFISGLTLPEGPSPVLDDRTYQIVRPDRRSWITLVKNQAEMQQYVDGISEILQKEFRAAIIEDRVFHVSLANLDGSPFASVGDVSWDDVGGRDVIQR